MDDLLKEGPGESGVTYSPLDDPLTSIRILQVLPDLLDGRIPVELRHERIPTKYRCLSYVWGNPIEHREILLNGRPFRVRKNLHDFLETARRRLPRWRIWIDALSIDQGNSSEKSQQVQRMGQIYENATDVLVWLGECPELDYVFDFVNALVKANVSASQVNAFSRLAEIRPERIDIGLRRLCTNPYWRRAWIAQEVLLAQEVHVLNGARHVEWRSAVRAIKEVKKFVTPQFEDVFVLSPMMKFWEEWPWRARYNQAQPYTRSIWQLKWVWDAQCTDARDRIYSLLALLENDNFGVDYSEDRCSLFWRAGEHFRAWNGSHSIQSLAQSLHLTPSILSENLRLGPPRYISLTSTHATFPDDLAPVPKVCEFCGTRLDVLLRKDVSLCIQDQSENRASQHAILHPNSNGSFLITLRSSYKTGLASQPRTLIAEALQYYLDGERAEMQGLPNWEHDVPGAEFRILLPAETIVQDLKALEGVDLVPKTLPRSDRFSKDELEKFNSLPWKRLREFWEATICRAVPSSRKAT